MSEGKKLNAAKVSKEIVSGDYVLMQNEGAMKQMSATSLFAPAKFYELNDAAKGWTTVANLESLTPGGIITVADGVYRGWPCAYIFSVVMDYPRKPIVRAFSGKLPATKLRVVKTGESSYHVDVNLDTARMKVATLGLLTLNVVRNAEVEEGATVYEYTAAELSGGKWLTHNLLQMIERRWCA